MGVTGLNRTYFVVWTPHGHLIDRIKFDESIWEELKENTLVYYNDFYFKTIFCKVYQKLVKVLIFILVFNLTVFIN